MKTVKIVLATHNKGKVEEIRNIMAELNIEILTLDDFPEICPVEETGSTFEENAILKAQSVAKASRLISIADDSGLVVKALNGAPGIYSARYGDDWEEIAGETKDQRNIRKLLSELNKVDSRDCKFVTAIAAAKPDGKLLVAKGEWHGLVLNAPQGHNGFGYDPVFYDPQLKKSAAQMSGSEKNARSHRGKAIANLLKTLPDFVHD